MAQSASSVFLDGTLDKLSTLSSVMYICRGQPTTYGSATTQGSQMLAQVNVSAGVFTKSDYASGRQTTVASQTATVSATGTADHVVLMEAFTSTLHFVNTGTAQLLTAGNTVTVNAFVVKVSNPGQ